MKEHDEKVRAAELRLREARLAMVQAVDDLAGATAASGHAVARGDDPRAAHAARRDARERLEGLDAALPILEKAVEDAKRERDAAHRGACREKLRANAVERLRIAEEFELVMAELVALARNSLALTASAVPLAEAAGMSSTEYRNSFEQSEILRKVIGYRLAVVFPGAFEAYDHFKNPLPKIEREKLEAVLS